MAYLSTEQVKAVRNELKKLMPTKDGWKLSVTRDNYSTVRVAIMKSPIKFDSGYETINHYHFQNHEYTETQKSLFACMMFAINKGVGYDNFDRNAGDMGADYSDCNYYIDLGIGKWDKHCEFIN